MEVRNHSNEAFAMVLAVRRAAGDKVATMTEDPSVTTVAGSNDSKAAGGRVRAGVGAAMAGQLQLLPRGSCSCKVEASVHGPGHGGDGSGGAGVLVLMRRYSVSGVVVV